MNENMDHETHGRHQRISCRTGNNEFSMVSHEETGFTLIELVVVMALGSLILFAMYGVLDSQQKIYRAQEEVLDMRQNIRNAMDTIARDIRMSGCCTPTSNLASWVTWVARLDGNPQIADGGGSNPDSFSIVTCPDRPAGVVTCWSASGTATLTVSSGSKFNTTTRKLISIGEIDTAHVKSIAGNTLTIDCDPLAPGDQGTTRPYAAGTPVYVHKVITYSVEDHILKRDENLGAGAQPLAENIEDLQVTQAGNIVTLSITARTAHGDPLYVHPAARDNYRRMTLTSRLEPRNL